MKAIHFTAGKYDWSKTKKALKGWRFRCSCDGADDQLVCQFDAYLTAKGYYF
jgi:hypothetical protein